MALRIPHKIDALVVGAGTAGCTAARALAEAGREVLLVESKPVTDVGTKICGNALSNEGVETISTLIGRPDGPEIAGTINDVRLVLPDKTTLSTHRGGVVLNRHVFGQRLLADAVQAGVVFIDSCSCAGWDERDRRTVNVRCPDGPEKRIECGLAIDASGYRGVLTRDGGPSHVDPLTRESVGIGYREIRPFAEPGTSGTEALVFLDAKLAPGGYGWVFPVGAGLANVGIGARLATIGDRLRSSFDTFIETQEGLASSDPLMAGTGMLPLRTPIHSMVGDGFMSVGDAACQTNPLHGGGISPSIVAGAIAGEVGAQALADGDTSTTRLWEYGVRFMRSIGARHAAHDRLRHLTQGLPDADLTFLVRQVAGSGAARRAMEDGGLRVSLRDAFKLIVSAARKPGLARVLMRAGVLIQQASSIYQEYPESPARLGSWIGRAELNARAMIHLVGAAE